MLPNFQDFSRLLVQNEQTCQQWAYWQAYWQQVLYTDFLFVNKGEKQCEIVLRCSCKQTVKPSMHSDEQKVIHRSLPALIQTAGPGR